MKLSAIFCLLVVATCGCNRNNLQSNLLSEQKILKDSAHNINGRIGDYMHKGLYDSAEVKKLQLQAMYARLIDIQSSIDSLANVQ